MTTSGSRSSQVLRGFGNGCRLGDDLEVLGALEGAAKPLADQLVVINEQHANRHARPSLAPATAVGSSARCSRGRTSTLVPPPVGR